MYLSSQAQQVLTAVSAVCFRSGACMLVKAMGYTTLHGPAVDIQTHLQMIRVLYA